MIDLCRDRLGWPRRGSGHRSSHCLQAACLDAVLPRAAVSDVLRPGVCGAELAARLQPNETLLVHGAAGAVGLAAVELGKAMGARVIATASTAEKPAVAQTHGADGTVLFPSDGALNGIKALAPNGADVVFDPVGGDVFELSLRAVAQCGRILVIGFANGRIQQIPANILLVKNVAVLGFNYGKYIGWSLVDERHQHEPMVRAAFEKMFLWFEQGKLHPTTSHRFPLSDYAAAMDAVLARLAIGQGRVGDAARAALIKIGRLDSLCLTPQSRQMPRKISAMPADRAPRSRTCRDAAGTGRGGPRFFHDGPRPPDLQGSLMVVDGCRRNCAK